MRKWSSQSIEEDDIAAVIEVLTSEWLTTGPKIQEFESALKNYVSTEFAVAVSSGTAALHAAMYAIGIEKGDEVIVSPMTFIATANAIVYLGGIPIFADINYDTMLIDPAQVESKITNKTKAIVTVDYAGHPSDYNELLKIARKHSLFLVADACHSLGATYKEKPVGALADISIFSFHPVKAITTGEGGMAVTNSKKFSDRMRRFRNHNIDADSHLRKEKGSWEYSIKDLGCNYRITDIQCALGIEQLKKLPKWIARRQEIAVLYDKGLAGIKNIAPISKYKNIIHAYHLYVTRLLSNQTISARADIFRKLQNNGLGVNVHYIPVHMQPYYQTHFDTKIGLCPNAEKAYQEILSLPIFPSMTDLEVETGVNTLRNVLAEYTDDAI